MNVGFPLVLLTLCPLDSCHGKLDCVLGRRSDHRLVLDPQDHSEMKNVLCPRVHRPGLGLHEIE